MKTQKPISFVTIALYIAALQVILYLSLQKLLNGFSGYATLTNGMQVMLAQKITHNLADHLTWWNVVVLLGMGLGGFIVSKYCRSLAITTNKLTWLNGVCLLIGGWCFGMAMAIASNAYNAVGVLGLAQADYNLIIILLLASIIASLWCKLFYRS